MQFSMTGQEKGWPFNTGDCLIEVTSRAGLTVLLFYMKKIVKKLYIFLVDISLKYCVEDNMCSPLVFKINYNFFHIL